MQSALRLTLACCAAVLLAGCAKTDEAATDTAAASAPAPAPAPALSLADVAGKWQVRAVPESGADTTTTTYVLTATAEPAGWTVTYPSGLTVPLEVQASGDSINTKTGEFASQRRKGVKVWTEGTLRIQDGKLSGRTVAHYTTTGADSVLRLRSEGTRMP